MKSKRPLVVAALVVAALLVGILGVRGRQPRPVGEMSDISSAKPLTARLAALDSSFRALRDGDSLTPRDRWDRGSGITRADAVAGGSWLSG